MPNEEESFKISGVMMKAGVPGISGRIYPKELLEQMEKYINEKSLLITRRPDNVDIVDLKDVIGSVDSAHVKEQDLVCDGQVTRDIAELIRGGKLFLTPMGQGQVVDGRVDPSSYSIKATVLSPFNGWENQGPCEIEEE